MRTFQYSIHVTMMCQHLQYRDVQERSACCLLIDGDSAALLKEDDTDNLSDELTHRIVSTNPTAIVIDTILTVLYRERQHSLLDRRRLDGFSFPSYPCQPVGCPLFKAKP